MKETITETRTYRRFQANERIDKKDLIDLIELARLGGSARNCQPWQYLLVNSEELCSKIYPFLGWAGYLADWKGPIAKEQPTAYILCILNKNWLIGPTREAYFDLGISTQNILLGATEKGYGGCRIASFSPKLASLFPLDEHLELNLVIALGKPAETIKIVDCIDEDIKYWRDSKETHYVPKRALKDILLSFGEQ